MSFKIISPYTMKYGEFPDVLFGRATNGSLYFDSTHYIAKQGDEKKHCVNDFNQKFRHWIEAISQAYSLPSDEIVFTDEATGHVLIEESLALLFVSYVDPDFCIYILERVSEVLQNGVSLSDTCVIHIIKERFSKDYLLAKMEEYGE